MLLAAAAVLLIAVTVFFTFSVRPKDLPIPEPVAPGRHLEERKAAIYENLRDLQFEYRVGKLSDTDYQQTKTGLQKELAVVLAEIEGLKSGAVQTGEPQARVSQPKLEQAAIETEPEPVLQCSHCGAKFEKNMKFCGECGKEMA